MVDEGARALAVCIGSQSIQRPTGGAHGQGRPGEQASRWDECLASNYIAVDWEAIGDLREYESFSEFERDYEELASAAHRGHLPTIKRQARSLWLLRELEEGDLVVANKGTARVLAVGTVTEAAYEWDDARPNYKHLVHVAWDTDYAMDIPPQAQWRDTIVPVSDELRALILGTKAPELLPPLLSRVAEALERKGQVILYGPPGTGKTYHARRFRFGGFLSKPVETRPRPWPMERNLLRPRGVSGRRRPARPG